MLARMMPHEQRTAFGTVVMALCLGYMIFRPVSNNFILYPALALLGIISVSRLVNRATGLGRRLAPTAVLGGLAVALGLVVGVGNPGWWHAFIPWLAGPLVFWAWTVSMDTRALRAMVTTSAWATVGLSAFIVLYVGSQQGYLPSVIPAGLLEETGAGFDGTGPATAIRLYGLSSLAAVAPMWVASLFVTRHPLLPSISVRVVAASLAVAAAMLGGRRVIILIALATPLVVWALKLLMRERETRTVIPVGPVIAGVLSVPVAIVVLPSLLASAPVQRAWAAVEAFFSDDVSVIGTGARTQQIEHLAEATAGSPFFGHGFGAVLDSGFFRNAERPWEFEMQYSLILFQIGLIGAAFLVLAFVFALVAARVAALNRPDMVPVLLVTAAGAVGMLAANATNPYLQAPGHLWPVFLALASINVALNLSPHGALQGGGPATSHSTASRCQMSSQA